MSRRTKLAIAALFMLLGGIAITFAVLALLVRPEHPLRFTVAQQRPPDIVSFGDTRGVPLEVLVENGSDHTLLLHGGYIGRAASHPPNLASDALGTISHFSNAPPDGNYWILPPHSATRVTFFCWELEDLRGNDILFCWSTPFRTRFHNALDWIHTRTPSWLYPLLPASPLIWETTPLEVPPNPFAGS